MRSLILFAALSLTAGIAGAETLYKLISPDGKVTYSSEPPKNFDGKVIKMDIDPNANTTEGRPVPKKVEPKKSNLEIIQSNPKAEQEDKLAQAKEKLDEARQAYEQARDNPGPNDIQRIGSAKGGGARPIPSEEYVKRLEKLEADMKAAQAEVDRLERGL
jgi:hypothetical protein